MSDSSNDYEASVFDELRMFMKDLHGSHFFKFNEHGEKVARDTAKRIAALRSIQSEKRLCEKCGADLG